MSEQLQQIDTENTFGHFQAWLESKNLYREFVSDETSLERMTEIIKRYDLET